MQCPDPALSLHFRKPFWSRMPALTCTVFKSDAEQGRSKDF